jgi:hypothetical protein
VAVAACSARCEGSPRATTLPWSMSATVSQSRPASSVKWVTSTIVIPLSRTLSIRPHVSRRGSGIEPGRELVQDGGLHL